jgi:exodeoxyribonuclease VII large subunit
MQSRRGLVVASQARLQALNPRATLARGYAIVQDDQGRIVERAGQLAPDDAVRIQFDDGLVDARVVRIERE